MNRKQRKGVALIYITVAMTAMLGFCSLAVDLGRAQMVKTQLRSTADAAARSAALGITTGTSIADAIDIANRNTADGKPVVILPSDVVLGYWDTNLRVFTPGGSNINAAQCSAAFLTSRGTGLKMMFAPALGFKSLDIHASATAMLVPPLNVNQLIQATANPFLSGMPAGSTASEINPHHDVDHAGTSTNPLESPTPLGMPISGGTNLTFTSITGTARHDPNLADYEPDGQLDNIGHNNLTTVESGDYANTMYSENGIADVWAPIDALVGVFLDDSAPNTTPTPSSLDFSTAASRDFSVLKPQLKQIFFIGDGENSAGVAQQFVAPKGATRLFLATWDFYEWSNNSGNRTVKVSANGTVTLVK
jgi:hypothetical protein